MATRLTASPRHWHMCLILQSLLTFYLFLSYNDIRVENHSCRPMNKRRIKSSPSLNPTPEMNIDEIGDEALNRLSKPHDNGLWQKPVAINRFVLDLFHYFGSSTFLPPCRTSRSLRFCSFFFFPVRGSVLVHSAFFINFHNSFPGILAWSLPTVLF